jgi:DNA-binding transcriptional regulator YiaG
MGRKISVKEPTGDERRDLVKKVRFKLQISQEELAKRLGFTKQTVCHWETGKTVVPSVAYLLLKKM